MKIVINRGYGSFHLSFVAGKQLGLKVENIAEPGEPEELWLDDRRYFNGERNDPELVRVVEELDKAANGWDACLKVMEIPDGAFYQIIADEFGGEWLIWSMSEIHIMYK